MDNIDLDFKNKLFLAQYVAELLNVPVSTVLTANKRKLKEALEACEKLNDGRVFEGNSFFTYL